MSMEIHDPAIEVRIKKQPEATGSASIEEVLLHLLDTQDQQDRWLLENRQATGAQIKRGLEQLDRGEGISEEQLPAYLGKLKNSKWRDGTFSPLRRRSIWS